MSAGMFAWPGVMGAQLPSMSNYKRIEITESQILNDPSGGKAKQWRVILVGGGGGGYCGERKLRISNANVYTPVTASGTSPAAGGSTSFGTYLTAYGASTTSTGGKVSGRPYINILTGVADNDSTDSRLTIIGLDTAYDSGAYNGRNSTKYKGGTQGSLTNRTAPGGGGGASAFANGGDGGDGGHHYSIATTEVRGGDGKNGRLGSGGGAGGGATDDATPSPKNGGFSAETAWGWFCPNELIWPIQITVGKGGKGGVAAETAISLGYNTAYNLKDKPITAGNGGAGGDGICIIEWWE